MTGAAFGRQLECSYGTWPANTIWSSFKWCSTYKVDYSTKFETEKHSFSITKGSSVQKSELSGFYIWFSPQVDFIPLDILTEFPNLNRLMITDSNLPTVKSGLFTAEFQRIELLYLGTNKIELIEPKAFQYLINLKWIALGNNNLKTLPHQIFKNTPDLVLIGLKKNKINSILPNFFDGLKKLKLVSFTEGNLCVNIEIWCETCLITQSELREKFRGCFDNYCGNDTTCQNSYKAQESTQSKEIIPQTTTEEPIETNITETLEQEIEETNQTQSGDVDQKFNELLRDTQMAVEEVKQELSDMKTSLENMPKVIEESIEANNKLIQKAVEKMLKKSVAEIKSCCAGNQEETANGQTEISKLKIEKCELKSAKNELALNSEIKALKEEIENLKREIDGQKGIEIQLESLGKSLMNKLRNWIL
jgi:hypothetical protein